MSVRNRKRTYCAAAVFSFAAVLPSVSIYTMDEPAYVAGPDYLAQWKQKRNKNCWQGVGICAAGGCVSASLAPVKPDWALLCCMLSLGCGMRWSCMNYTNPCTDFRTACAHLDSIDAEDLSRADETYLECLGAPLAEIRRLFDYMEGQELDPACRTAVTRRQAQWREVSRRACDEFNSRPVIMD